MERVVARFQSALPTNVAMIRQVSLTAAAEVNATFRRSLTNDALSWKQKIVKPQ